MTYFIRIVERVGRMGAAVSSVVFTAMMMLIVVNVIVRLAGSAISGSFAAIELLAVLAITPAIIYTQIEGSHINIVFLTSILPNRLRIVFRIVADAISIGIWFIAAWGGFRHAQIMWTRGETIQELSDIFVPPFRYFWVLGLILLCLSIATTLFKDLYMKKKD